MPHDHPFFDELDCNEVVEIVTDYLEGAMSDSDRTRFELHLVACEPCEVYLAQMRETIRSVGRLAPEDADPRGMDALLHAFRGWKAAQG